MKPADTASTTDTADRGRADSIPETGNPIVCHCMRVDLATIQAALDAGARSVAALQDATRVCLGCGTCRFDLLELLAAADRAARPEAT